MGESAKARIFEELDYEPTPLQREIHESTADYRIVAAGVRLGKSFLAAHEAVAALIGEPGTKGWVVTPERSLGKPIYDEVKRLLQPRYDADGRHIGGPPKGFLKRSSDIDFYVRCANGSELWVKSASNKQSLMGASLDFAIVDEASRVDEEAMNMTRLRLLDRNGWFLAISTPNGRNWFYSAYLKGQDRESNPDWQSWSAPTWANPYIDAARIEEMRRTMPERHFMQDVEARFLDDEGAVFKNIGECATINTTPDPGPAPNAGAQYVVSADLGRHQDWTAVFVWDVKHKSAVHFEYYQGSWTNQIARLKATCARYNRATLIVDATGEGDAVHERLVYDNGTEKFSRRIYGERLYDVKRKREIVEALILALENKEISFVRHPRVLRELGEYEFHRSPKTNNVIYSAPQNAHDDSVMSLALGWSLVGKLRSTAQFRIG